jgi:hypothetical protein
MPGLVPGIHENLSDTGALYVDGRVKPGHDEKCAAPSPRPPSEKRALREKFLAM